MRSPIFAFALGAMLLAGTARGQTTSRVKDVTRLEGVRGNQLIGYGLVVGLAGSGDSKQTLFTTQSITSMLSRFGVEVPAAGIKVKNVAAVIVTAELPAFARSGDQIDVVVSSLGDASSLQGGTLLQTPLNGADSQTYAVAQGAISIGGFDAGGGGASVTKNHPTAGRIPNGALVEKEVSMTVSEADKLSLSLREPDFSAAAAIAHAVAAATGATAVAEDAGRVRIDVPAKYRSHPVEFVALVEAVSVPIAPSSKVVVNERTGTIVIGGAVHLSPVAVAQGGLTVAISTQTAVSQPPSLSNGATVVTTQKSVAVQEQHAATVLLQSGETIQDLIKALNAIKATPRDIIAILQAIKAAGAMQGDLEIL